jgi:hypothetical protein
MPSLDQVLEWYSQLGHGRLWCTCGYLIWGCAPHKECSGPLWIIETDHTLCKKKTK